MELRTQDTGESAYRRYLAGDNNALCEIVRLYSDGLLCFIHGYVKDINAAEDVMSDVFLKLVIGKHNFKGESSFKTYLYTIARNKSLDYLRKAKHTVIKSQDSDFIDDTESPESVYLREERQAMLNRAMNSLSYQYRDVLYLAYFEGMDNAGICAVLKKSKKQVENLLCRAKKSLRELLERNGYSYENL